MNQLVQVLQSDYPLAWRDQLGRLGDAAYAYRSALLCGVGMGLAAEVLEMEAVALSQFEREWEPLLRVASGEAALRGLGLDPATRALRRAALDLALLHCPRYTDGMPEAMHRSMRAERLPALLACAVMFVEHFAPTPDEG